MRAIWFYPLDALIDMRLLLHGNRIVGSTRPALHVIGKLIRELLVSGLRVEGAGWFGVQVQAPGRSRFSGVAASGLARGCVAMCAPAFAIAWADPPTLPPADVDCAKLPRAA